MLSLRFRPRLSASCGGPCAHTTLSAISRPRISHGSRPSRVSYLRARASPFSSQHSAAYAHADRLGRLCCATWQSAPCSAISNSVQATTQRQVWKVLKKGSVDNLALQTGALTIKVQQTLISAMVLHHCSPLSSACRCVFPAVLAWVQSSWHLLHQGRYRLRCAASGSTLQTCSPASASTALRHEGSSYLVSAASHCAGAHPG